MEVTRTNFQQLLPRIKEAIKNSDFISVDCELTGLNNGADINAYDTQSQYYDKVRKAAKDFLVIQYGICIFRYDKILKVFKQQAFNFYVFPKPTNKYVPDHRFLCQASSIDFLISQGFNFNKLFKEGISYLNATEENKYKSSLAEQQKLRANQLQNAFSPQNEKSNHISMSVEDKSSVDNIFKQIDEFIISDQEEMNLPRCNAYIRRLVYQEAPIRLENKVSLETRILENKDRVLVVTRLKNKEEREKEERKRVEEEQQEHRNCIGFSEIIKIIVSSEKLIIGHNMCLDLLHTIDKFLTPLPQEYKEFKDMTCSLFPNLLDTKYMSSAAPFKELINSNVLAHLLQTVQEKPFEMPVIEIEEGGESYDLNCNKEHEAGYDAFVTGLSFLAMWKYLGSLEDSVGDPFTDFSLLEPYKNRLFLMRLQDSPYIHIGGNDPILSRDHVLYITFPREWKLNDILQLFSPFGNVHVAWIDDRSAYVGLQKRDQTAVALSTLSQSDTYTVTSYNKRQAQLAACFMGLSYSVLPSPRRKSSIGSLSNSIKKKRTSSFGESSVPKKKRSIDPIEEDPEKEADLCTLEISDVAQNLVKVKKTFEENTNWD